MASTPDMDATTEIQSIETDAIVDCSSLMEGGPVGFALRGKLVIQLGLEFELVGHDWLKGRCARSSPFRAFHMWM